MSYLKKAHELADLLVETPEYKNYMELNKSVYWNNAENRKKIDQYRQQIVEYEDLPGDETENKELLQEIQQLETSLMEDEKIAAYLKAESDFSFLLQQVLDIIDEKIQGNDANS